MMFSLVAFPANRYQPPRRVFVVEIAIVRPPAPLAYASAAEPGLLDCLAVFGLALWGQDSSLNMSVWLSSLSIRLTAISQ